MYHNKVQDWGLGAGGGGGGGGGGLRLVKLKILKKIILHNSIIISSLLAY